MKRTFVEASQLPNPAISTTVLHRLEKFVALLDQWRKVTNLVSERAFQQIWTDHITNGALVQMAVPSARSWLDVGSGAGLPGAIIAAILADFPDARVQCVEPDGRKCAFLREVAETVEIPIRVHNTRLETLVPSDLGPVHAVTARAFSSMSAIIRIADPFLLNGAVAVLPRGSAFRREILEVDQSTYHIAVKSGGVYGNGALVIVGRHDRKSDAPNP